MRNLIVCLFVIISMPAMAEHHIGHVYPHLDAAQAQFNKVSNSTNHMYLCPNWTDFQVHAAKVQMPNYLNKVQAGMDATRAVLIDAQATVAAIDALPEGDPAIPELETTLKQQLLDARGILSQPAPVGVQGQESTLYYAGYMIVVSKYLIEDHNVGAPSAICPEAAKKVSQLQLNAITGLRSLMFASWHIDDAIKELVYKDEQFICAGHNNHCE